MKKWMMVLLCCMCISLLAACGSSGGGEAATEEKVYLEESQIGELFSHPDDFKGKYVKLKGQVFTTPEKDGDLTALQIWYDPVNAENSYLVYTNSSESFSENDYVFVDGKIDGTFEGENLLGGTVTVPLIKDATVEKSTYVDVMVPTIKSIEPAAKAEQHDFSMTVDKVEYAEKETRVFVTLKNDRDDTVSAGVYSTKIIQDGKQISPDETSSSAYDGQYPELDSDVQPGATSNGIIVFPAIDQEKDFTFVMPDNYCDDYEIEFKDFKVEISAK